MINETEVLLLPYDSVNGDSLMARLVSELQCGKWTRFRAAVAFARVSGNDQRLIGALKEFGSRGGEIQLTFGADTFAGNAKGSDFEAIHELVTSLDNIASAQINLYHETSRTFHPKIYFFDHEQTRRALLIVGSSNWGNGGLVNNIEANVLVHLDLSVESHLAVYERVSECFTTHWSDT